MNETHDSIFNNESLNRIYEKYKKKTENRLTEAVHINYDVSKIEEHFWNLNIPNFMLGYGYKNKGLIIKWSLMEYKNESRVKVAWVEPEEAALINEKPTEKNGLAMTKICSKYPYKEFMKKFCELDIEDHAVIFKFITHFYESALAKYLHLDEDVQFGMMDKILNL